MFRVFKQFSLRQFTCLELQLLIRSNQIHVLKNNYHSKENNMKSQYANEFVQKIGMGDPTTFIYQIIYDEKDRVETKIIQFSLYIDWDYVSR